MLNFLNSKHMCRKSSGFIEIFTIEKKFEKFLIIIFSADSPVLNLHNKSCVLNNAPDYIIRNFQNFFTLTFTPIRIYKPVFQSFPFALHIFTYTGFRISVDFKKCMGNIQFALYYFFQNFFFHKRNIFQ